MALTILTCLLPAVPKCCNKVRKFRRKAAIKQPRFTDEQIIRFLKKADAGMSVKELYRSGGFSQPTSYKWSSRFGGMEPSDAAKHQELEAENNKFKKPLAEAHLYIYTLNSVNSVES